MIFIPCTCLEVHAITMIRSRRISSVRHVARIGENRNAYKLLVGKPEGEISLEDKDVDG
jgi:hypothetical protein